MACLSMHTVSLVVMHLGDGCVDGNLVEVGSAEPGDLGVDVRMNASGKQRIVREIEPGNNVRRAECDLLGFRKKIVGISVKDETADRRHRHQFFRDYLGGVQHIERETLRLVLGKYLNAQLPLGKCAGLDRLPEISTMEVGVRAGNLHRFVPDQRVRACDRVPMELHEARLSIRVHEAKRMDTKSLHHSKAARDGPV